MATSVLAAGTTISIDNEIGTPVVIGGVTSFSIADGQAAEIRTTSLADAAHTFAVGLAERGDFTIDLIRNLDDVGQIELFDASKDQTIREIIVTFPTGTINVFTFDAVTKSLTTVSEVDGVLTGTATLKISGEIVES